MITITITNTIPIMYEYDIRIHTMVTRIELRLNRRRTMTEQIFNQRITLLFLLTIISHTMSFFVQIYHKSSSFIIFRIIQTYQRIRLSMKSSCRP